jgi:hypothetical protein
MAYQDPKEHGGKAYRGMKVGGSHLWSYPDGEWREKKLEPNRWQVEFTSLKRRKRRAPSGSGAEVGSGYHWLIIGHQWVTKLDANTYATQLEGTKYLIAFKKPDWPVWNTGFRGWKGARDKTIQALEDAIQRIQAGPDVEDPASATALEELAAKAAEVAELAEKAAGKEKMEFVSQRTRPKRTRAARKPRKRALPTLEETRTGS